MGVIGGARTNRTSFCWVRDVKGTPTRYLPHRVFRHPLLLDGFPSLSKATCVGHAYSPFLTNTSAPASYIVVFIIKYLPLGLWCRSGSNRHPMPIGRSSNQLHRIARNVRAFMGYLPVEPNPPFPRSVSSRLSTTSSSGSRQGRITSWAILSPALNW